MVVLEERAIFSEATTELINLVLIAFAVGSPIFDGDVGVEGAAIL